MTTAAVRPPANPGAVERSTQASWLEFAIVWVTVSAGVYLLGEYLFAHGFISLNLVFFAEKAQLALSGSPPRLVNIGFVYPPLSFGLMMPFFTNPILAQAVISGLTVAGVFRFLDLHVASGLVRRLAKAYVLASPTFLFLTVENYSYLLLAVLLALAVLYIGLHLDYGYSLHLFMAGGLYGLTFFIDFRTIWLLIVLVPSISGPLLRRSIPHAISVSLTIALPFIFMASAWIYVNWIFLGNGLGFIFGRSSFFRTFAADPTIAAVAWDPVATLVYSIKLLVIMLPVIACYFVGLALVRSNQPSFQISTMVIYGFPVLFMVLTLYTGMFAPSVSFLAIFLLTMFFEIHRMRPSRWLPIVMLVTFCCSFLAPIYSPNREERDFARALYTGRIVPNIAEFEAVANCLQAHPGGRILADDTIFYPVVFLVGDASRFILPFEYEYDTIVANPVEFARIVIAARRGATDTVASIHPTIEQGWLPGYHAILTEPDYIVFERSEP
jgi:hypothetical protein